MIQRIVLGWIAFMACVTTSNAQYYNSAFGLNGTALKTALHNIIKNHSVGTYSDLWNYFNTTDNKVNGVVYDIYSDLPGSTPPYIFILGSNKCGTYNQEGDCYNREHTWPSTFFGGNTPMYTDIQHIFPTDGWVNNKRGNLPYGKVKSGGVSWTSDNGSKTGTSLTYPGYVDDVFEPIDSFKGDLARVYFYMSTRYEGEDGGWTNWEMANGAELTPAAVTLLLTWHHLDPVSQKEINRNNAVYAIQNNRNPFIDYPIFADCIWGSSSCTSVGTDDVSLSTRVNVFPNPASDRIQLEVPNDLQLTSYHLYSLLGTLVQTAPLHSTMIELPSSWHGNYVLMLESNKGIIRKIVSIQ
jgi:endonuclease I